MSASQELVVRASTDLAQLAELEKILLGMQEPPEIVEDPVAQAREIIAQILSSETEEEVEAFGDAIGWRELCRRFVKHDGLPVQDGVPIELSDFRWRTSEYEDGSPVFFIVRGRRMDDGSNVTLTTGSSNILAQLVAWARIEQQEGRPVLRGRVVIATERDKETKSGYWPTWLETVQAPSAGEETAALPEAS